MTDTTGCGCGVRSDYFHSEISHFWSIHGHSFPCPDPVEAFPNYLLRYFGCIMVYLHSKLENSILPIVFLVNPLNSALIHTGEIPLNDINFVRPA